ncbi:MAG: cofactor assembly of complex C subunit B [Pseudanabaena sp. M135S2SP2A07QC]|nr:cofactor assembly of complex C subunit B [Chitinophagaceae bacterium]MCA6506324.1 cofactor assembly of complex C subunit B [Pseudanabaena sp. M172S2SP2A07QC]MCA6517473.1 cofactor assembly of complex C subunit B [Pseudanabaena sp. M110S1SP2A07QC]MCA6532241.1 cofactor assembly of complex C subunit B [Pseudanabaena sp. M125S2SP2A07QC]MCA6533971.1 cofactor assembly of complex C subunit B [Pseudanabaena sp. M176S2SP2A07QC]MCA6541128.1 cofactor assembly of complex C subunit B [Pseudanabaena sp. M
MIRYLPLVVGTVGGLALLANRMVTANLTASQSRADALGVLLSAVLILIGLLWQQVQPKPPEAVILVGEEGLEIDENLPEAVKTELAWATHILLTNTVTKAVAIYYDHQTILRRGILGKSNQVNIGTIAARVMKTQKPIYLVKLELYPGRVEFDYLPENTQGVIVQPLGEKGVMVLGANIPRSYTKQDENWVTAIADKLTYNLEKISS